MTVGVSVIVGVLVIVRVAVGVEVGIIGKLIVQAWLNSADKPNIFGSILAQFASDLLK